jgi:hypothetical protein
MRVLRRVVSVSVAAGVALAAMTAVAAPLTVRHGRTIKVSLAGRSEEAVALRATPEGWRLELAGTLAGTTVSLRDVTAGSLAATRYDLSFVAAGMVLDNGRFRADHAYRLEVRRGTVVVGNALIYLSPPPRGKGRVVFDDRDATNSAAVSDDGLAPSDKGSL